MKRLLSLLVVLVLLGTKLVFAEEKTSGDGPAHFTFVQLTNLQIENVEKISIGCSKCGLGLSEYFVSSPLIISDIYNTFKDIQFTEDTRDGSAGGWVYGINFYMKDGTYVQFGTRLHIDKVDYNAVDFAVVLEKMAYYHDLIEDIDSSEWAINYILEFQKLGFLDDVTDISYKEPITREKFCEIICNVLDRNMNIEWKKVSPNPFTDTDNEKVISLRLEGIINGREDCKFAPDDYLTREEAATIIARAMKRFRPDIPVTEIYFNYEDIDEVSEWALDSVQLISNSGIMSGVGENKFSPQGTYTTEQAIVSVVLLYNNILSVY